MNSIALLATGLGVFLVALNLKEEIFRILCIMVGSVALVWGFSLTPFSLQLLAEIAIVTTAFYVSVRCLGCN